MTAYPSRITLQVPAIGPVQLALFAAASGDHNPLHLDPAVAVAAGFERPLVHGMLTMALAGRLFTQHFGIGCVRQLHTRFAGVALVGDSLELSATLDREDAAGAHYTVQGATSAGRLVVTGTAVVAGAS